jgi:hypothetical protein
LAIEWFARIITDSNSPDRNFEVDKNPRSAFAIDYIFDAENLALSVSGWKKPIPIIGIDTAMSLEGSKEKITVTARIGDQDGANLPWFEYADATLLYWWIDRDTIRIPVTVHRSEEGGGIHNLDLRIAGSDHLVSSPLLSIQMKANSSTIVATAPARPDSSSPSSTYPTRIVLIHIVAPIAVLVAGVVGIFLSAFGDSLTVLFAATMYGFLILAIIVSLWRCLGGPTLEDTVDRVHDCLDSWKENERLRRLPLDTFQDRLVQVYRNERVKAFLYVCANGWHPEREAARAAEKGQADVEKGESDSGRA